MATLLIPLMRIQQLISIEDFNELILAQQQGDDEWIAMKLEDAEEDIIDTPEANDWNLILHRNGVNYDNFPWEELQELTLLWEERIKTEYLMNAKPAL